MNDFITQYREEIIQSLITFAALLAPNFILRKGISKVGKTGRLKRARTLLIIKYVNAFTLLIAITLASFIWSVNFSDLGLVFSSVFAVLGVALFAQWSILSNVTSGVILFFSFPFKIGDRIRVQDSDFPSEAVIEDIRAFHIHLRTNEGELITYPNNLLLQKGIVVVNMEKPKRRSRKKIT